MHNYLIDRFVRPVAIPDQNYGQCDPASVASGAPSLVDGMPKLAIAAPAWISYHIMQTALATSDGASQDSRVAQAGRLRT